METTFFSYRTASGALSGLIRRREGKNTLEIAYAAHDGRPRWVYSPSLIAEWQNVDFGPITRAQAEHLGSLYGVDLEAEVEA